MSGQDTATTPLLNHYLKIYSHTVDTGYNIQKACMITKAQKTKQGKMCQTDVLKSMNVDDYLQTDLECYTIVLFFS